MNNENAGPAGSVDNTRTVARNSFWYGLELFFGLGATLLTSIAVARVVGPVKLSYFQYLVFLTNVTVGVGAFGVSSAARKYMAECLNSGQPEVARALYLSTLKIQASIAVAASAISLALAYWLGDPHQLAVAALLIMAMAPRLVATIPSQANNAAEVMRRNTGPAVTGVTVNTGLTILCLLFLRGQADRFLIGVAAATAVGSYLECAMKLSTVERWMGGLARGTISPELKRHMFAYSGQGLALMLLNVVVFDKSDMVVLQALSGDKAQVTFFALACNLTDRVLMIPSSFGTSLAATMMAQYGRGQARLRQMTVDGARYALFLALPLLVGMACLSPLVPLLYKPQFAPMISTLSMVALFAISKAMVAAPTMLLQATARQGFLIGWGCVCGAVDIGLDFILIPRYGANGAAIANGVGQTMGALGIWIYAKRTNGLDLRSSRFGRMMLSGALMAAGVLAFTHAVPGYPGMFGSIAVGAAIWFLALRLTGSLKPEDVSRIASVGGHLPARFRPHWNRLIGWLAPAGSAA
jgi:O-antigen/teichoic acid export membrane protein